MKALALLAVGALFAFSGPAQASGPKARLVEYDWLPGRSMDDMARFVPDTGADQCQQRISFETPFGKKSRLQGSFLLSSVRFAALEAQPGQLGSRPSEDVVATTATGFIRGIELSLSQDTNAGQVNQKIEVQSENTPYQARYLLTQLGPVEYRMSLELGWATRTKLILNRNGKPYQLRAWLDCDPELVRCRIVNGQVTAVEDSGQGFKFDSPFFALTVKDACVRAP